MCCFGLRNARVGFASGQRYFAVMAEQTFRVKNTPQGTVLVKFYRVEPYSPDGLARQVMGDWWQTGKLSAPRPLYQGLIAQTTVLGEAVQRLAERCPGCNCVRVELTP